MPRRAPKKAQLAKLSRPRIHRAVPRERLFRRLDELCSQYSAVWISGPPGAGKTSLVSSWLDARRRPFCWYQVDSGDGDASTFISFLVDTAGHGPARESLPYLTIDYADDKAGFGRRFFRILFARFDAETVYVFDNCQEAAGADFHALLKSAMSQVPPAGCSIFVSREAPPQDFAKHLADRTIGLMEWDELRLTAEETSAIVGRGGTDGEAARRMHDRSGGWPAGVVLLLSAAGSGAADTAIPRSMSQEAIFAYFASEVFSRAEAADQDFLMRTALLPRITPETAMLLTGRSDASEVLERLFRRNFFTDRQTGLGIGYRYHDLFREFLLNRAVGTFPARQWRDVLLSASRILVERGDFDPAVALLKDAAAWEEIESVLRERAPEMMKQGRWNTILEWVDAAPPGRSATRPWLTYWRGMARSVLDIPAGRLLLAEAAGQFSAQPEPLGEMLALSAYIDGFCQEWHTVAFMDPFLDRLKELFLTLRTDAPRPLAASVRTTLLIALLYRRPGDPLLRELAAEVVAGLEEETDPNELLRSRVFLLFYYELMGNFRGSMPLVQMAKKARRNPRIAPRLRIWEAFRTSQYYDMQGEGDLAFEEQIAALRIAEEEGAQISASFQLVGCAHVLLSVGRIDEACGFLEKARSGLRDDRYMEVVYFRSLELWTFVLKGDLPRAHQLWDEFSRMPMVGVPFNTAYNHPPVFLLCERKEFQAAEARIERWRVALAGMGSPLLNFNLDVMDAFVALRSGRSAEVKTILSRAFEAGARHAFHKTLMWVPRMMGELCSAAMEFSIQPDYVRELVRRRKLQSPAVDAPWPWPVQIFTLGRFLVLIDGEPLRFGHRPQYRLLELLKAIISAGEPGASATDLAARLWEGLDGDAAHAALTVALHRLRKLLGGEESVRLDAGRVTLNGARCWVDAHVFEVRCNEILSGSGTKAEAGDWKRAVSIYAGHFLGGEVDSVWSIGYRDRLRAKFQRAVVRVARMLEDQGRWADAAEVYSKALDADALHEEFYRRLMACLVQRGEHADAVGVYRRCREMLTGTLGVEPSRETRAVLQSLGVAP
ncbi:MAG: hypothetical protein IPK20_22815 [Betaproteobacteria bacterium]|nr:hypothetical protein [Betaproteobacteria bacterium]